MSDKPLEYGKLIQILNNMKSLQGGIFHHSTQHKPAVSISTPSVVDDVAEFNVLFEWQIPRREEWSATDKRRWTRLKNIRQFMDKLAKAGEEAGLIFGINWEDIEFGVKGESGLVMYVTFAVGATNSEKLNKTQEG